MVDIPPIKPVSSAGGAPPVSGDVTTATGDLPFELGQRLFARVVQVLGERSAMLEMAGQRFVTSTPVPLSPGQIVDVAVRGAGPVVDLALLDPPETISERGYALAAVIEAKQGAPLATRVPTEAIRTLLQALQHAEPRADLPARAAAALLPSPMDADAGRIAERLQHAVRSSGAFLEARLAATMKGGTVDVARVADDTRVILAELQPHTSGSTTLEATRSALVSDTLARQADVAYHAVRDGEVRIDIPVLIGDTQTDVRLRVREDGERREGEPAAPGRQIDLTIDLPEFGAVRATLAWTPGHLTTRFAVADEAQAHALQAEIGSLTTRLRATGFREIATRVDVDPEALARVDEPTDPLPPGGSILRARA